MRAIEPPVWYRISLSTGIFNLRRRKKMDATMKLAEFAFQTSLADMGREVLSKGKERFLDTLACILAGSRDETAKIISRYVENLA